MEFTPDKAVVSIETIIESPFNPRRIDAKTLDKLQKSIQEFGYVDLLIVNKRNMQVVGGNQRLKALKALGFEEVEVVLVDLDDGKEKALNVALNKIQGDWDFEKLRDLLTDVSEDERLLTGFESSEIDVLLGSSGFDDGTASQFEGDSSGEESAGNEEKTKDTPGVPEDKKPYIVYISFKSKTKAEKFLADHGVKGGFDEGMKTFVWKFNK